MSQILFKCRWLFSEKKSYSIITWVKYKLFTYKALFYRFFFHVCFVHEFMQKRNQLLWLWKKIIDFWNWLSIFILNEFTQRQTNRVLERNFFSATWLLYFCFFIYLMLIQYFLSCLLYKVLILRIIYH